MSFLVLVALVFAPFLSSEASEKTASIRRLQESGIEVSNGRINGSRWTQSELAALSGALDRLPERFKRYQKRLKLKRSADCKVLSRNVEVIGRFNPKDRSIALYPDCYKSWLSTMAPEHFYLALQHAFVHELAHAFDDELGLSRSKDWRRISGWSEPGLRERLGIKPANDNVEMRGFAKPYGMESPAEDFATYAEEFFFFTEYEDVSRSLSCRSPSKYRFFKKLFPEFVTPHDDVVCPRLEDWVDPSKVEGLELLYASPSTARVASVAGHLLLRVRMSYQGEDEYAQNPNDLVIAFGAQTPKGLSGGSLAVAGLTGKLLSSMSEKRLSDVQVEYTERDDRDLWRFKLNLNPLQVRAVLERFFEIRSNFKYRYRFLTQNCASMVVDQIGIAIGDDSLEETPIGLESPTMLLAKLTQKGLLAAISPSFYGISRRVAIARSKKAIFYGKARSERLPPGFEIPLLSDLESADDVARGAAYEKLAAVAAAAPPVRQALFSVLLLSLEEERYRAISKTKSDGTESELRSGAHAALRRALYSIRVIPDFKKSAGEVRERSSLVALSLDAERSYRGLGSAHTGIVPIVVTPTYSIVSKKGHLELTLASAVYAQSIGDPSRFSMGRAVELELLSKSITVSLDDRGLTRWRAALLRVKALSTSPVGVGGSAVKGLKEGLSLGLQASLLEFSADDWKGRALDARWLGVGAIAALFSSEGMRDYLTLALGLEIGSVWMRDGAGPGRSFIGFPVELRGQVSLDAGQETILRGGFLFAPRINTRVGLEDEARLRGEVSRLIGEIGGVELRLNAGVEHEDDPATERLMLGVEGRNW